jgi:hypothetical protein
MNILEAKIVRYLLALPYVSRVQLGLEMRLELVPGLTTDSEDAAPDPLLAADSPPAN